MKSFGVRFSSLLRKPKKSLKNKKIKKHGPKGTNVEEDRVQKGHLPVLKSLSKYFQKNQYIESRRHLQIESGLKDLSDDGQPDLEQSHWTAYHSRFGPDPSSIKGYILVLTWGPSTYKVGEVDAPHCPSHWITHGVWELPVGSTKNSMKIGAQVLKTNAATWEFLKRHTNILEFKLKSAKRLYNHFCKEYFRHGSFLKRNHEDYFMMTVEMAEIMIPRVVSALERKGITPGESSVYSVGAISAALVEEFEEVVKIKDKDGYLYELQFYFDLDFSLVQPRGLDFNKESKILRFPSL